MSFVDTLKNNQWVDSGNSIEFHKGPWKLVFDTRSWIEVSTANNPRVFDVAVPEERLGRWTLNLIEHLCVTDDRIAELSEKGVK